MTRCFYFGCWNEAGHHLFGPGGRTIYYDERSGVQFYGSGEERRHLDGTLAPKRHRDGSLCWGSMAEREHEHCAECPQGQFLRHELANGFSAIQWWDRCQGDTRGACNSTIMLEGKHTSEDLLAALAEHFPHVLENLKRAGVELVEIKLPNAL